jgi:hypothetical protein
LEYEPSTLLGNLFADIPNNRKTKIALTIPVQNISKEEAKTLALLLANKRAKNLTNAAIPKRGGQEGKTRGGKKAGVKREVITEEVKKEKDIKIKEDIQEDSNDFQKANNVLCQKRKNQLNSLYLAT